MAKKRTRKKTTEEEEESQNELADVIKQVGKVYGDNIVRNGTCVQNFTHCETGIFILDFALLGGLAEGLASMWYGVESCGKSTLSLRAVAAKLRKNPDKKAVWVDSEQTFDIEWAIKHGIDPERIEIVQPESGEQAVDIIDAVMGSKETCIVVLDSVPATVPQQISDKSAADATVGKLAQLMSRLCSKILVSWTKERKRGHFVDVIFINQLREKIGVMFGSPETTPGGRQLNYLVTTKIKLRAKQELGTDEHGMEVVDHNKHTFTISKSKIGASIKSGEFKMIVNPSHELGQGTIDEVDTICTIAKKMGLLIGGGASWGLSYEEKKFKLADLKNYLLDNEDEYLFLKQVIIANQRISKGLPPLPRDGYLLGYIEENSILDALETAKK